MREIERLSCLDHYEDPSNHALCTELWSSLEGQDWALQTQSKQVIDNYLPKVLEALTDGPYKHQNHSLSKKIIR